MPRALLAVAVVAALLATGCSQAPSETPPRVVAVGERPYMHDVASEVGIRVTTGASVARLPAGSPRPGSNASDALGPPRDTMLLVGAQGMETMLGGIAVGDVDGNGWLDIVLADRPRSRLFLNQGGTYRDASDWLGDAGLGNATAPLLFDYDNDGYPDLFLAKIRGPSRLLHNEGGKGFRDVSWESRVAWDSAALGAAAADVDNDGLLDLLVVGYSAWWEPGRRTYRVGQPELLYMNNGDGTFRESGRVAGLVRNDPSLAAGFADYDRDGDQDVYVANDFETLGMLWRNRGDGTFEEAANQTGAISNRNGMGTVWEDFDQDGWLDLYVANIFQFPTHVPLNMGNQLFLNLQNGTFRDASLESGAADAAWAWGGAAFDAENDGDLDLYVPNGFPIAGVPAPLLPGLPPRAARFDEQPQRFFEAVAPGRFVSNATAWGLDAVMDGRAAVAFDHNGDGAVDLVATGIGASVRLYENRHPQGPSITLTLEGVEANRDAVGTQVIAKWDNASLVRQRSAGSGFLSQPGPVLHFGLGDAATADLEVRWPGGGIQWFPAVAPGSYHLRQGGTLVEGTAASARGAANP